MSEIEKAIYLLEDRLRVLLAKYELLKEENRVLFQNVNQLEYQIDKNQQLLANQNKEYELLKIAKTIEGSNGSTRETKLKINALIREVDKCIVQLNQ